MADRDNFIGKQLGSYRLLEELGAGGFGLVYKAEHIYLHKIAAIKVLLTENASQEERAQFIEEAKKHILLQHPSILPLRDVANEQGTLYMVMDYAPGRSLDKRLKDYRKKHPHQPFPLEEALTIVQQIGQALYFAHQQKDPNTRRPKPIVHLDLKPANILFNERGEALLADFGLATALSAGKTQRFERVAGTPDYMAPEQFAGDVSVKIDQYALGCIAYELFTGQHPFPVPNVPNRDIIIRGQHQETIPVAPIKLNPQLHPSINEAILKALAKNHNQRHTDVLAFLKALSKEQGQQPSPQKSFEQLCIEGNEFFDNGRYHDASIAYKQASKLRPDVADLYVNTGIAYYHLGQYNEAVVAFEQAIGCQHNHIRAYYHKGLALYELGQYDQAVAAYRETVSFQPDHTGAYQELGDTLYKLKQYEEAVQAYERAIQIDPNNANMYNDLGNSLRNAGKWKEAIQAFEQAIRLNPRLAKAYCNKGNVYYGCQKYEEALNAYNGALRENSQYANAYHGKSIALSQLGRLAEARQAEERARQFGYGE